MIQPTLPLTARFYLSSEEAPELSTVEVADAVRRHYPLAIVDWDRGRQEMADGLQRLIDMGCPEILYRGQKALLDKTIVIEIPVEGTSCCLSGHTFGFSYYDGCISLQCDPFEIDVLKTGARRFADHFDLEFELCAGDVGDLELTFVPSAMTPQEAVAYRFPREYFSNPSLTPLDDWKGRLAVACRDWLLKHPESTVVEKWLSMFGSEDRLSETLIARLESVGPIQAVSRLYFGDGKWHSSLVVEYSDWAAIVNLPGVPFRLLG